MLTILMTVYSLIDIRRTLIQYLANLTRMVTNLTGRCANKLVYQNFCASILLRWSIRLMKLNKRGRLRIFEEKLDDRM